MLTFFFDGVNMNHWNLYWNNENTLNSFAEGDQSTGYTGEIANFWSNAFSHLSDDASILDVATGNGALAVLAKKYSPSFRVTAIDAANINPHAIINNSNENYQWLKDITFKGNVRAEELPFEENSFNVVVSQFGFEYAEPGAALTHIHRVLQTNGEFVALIHHNTSFISADCRLGIDVLQDILVESELFDLLEAYCEASATLQSEKTYENEQHFQTLNKSLLALFKKMQFECQSEQQLDWYNETFKRLVPLIMDWQTLSLDKVKCIKNDLASHKLRLQDQVDAYWSEQQANDFIARFQSQWSSMALEQLTCNEGILCWVLRARK